MREGRARKTEKKKREDREKIKKMREEKRRKRRRERERERERENHHIFQILSKTSYFLHFFTKIPYKKLFPYKEVCHPWGISH